MESNPRERKRDHDPSHHDPSLSFVTGGARRVEKDHEGVHHLRGRHDTSNDLRSQTHREHGLRHLFRGHPKELPKDVAKLDSQVKLAVARDARHGVGEESSGKG